MRDINLNKRFEVLDSFRGLAAIFVVIHHMHYVGSMSEWSFFESSGLFVELFFILSGFVLSHSYAFKQNLKFRHFFISRTFRLMPLHIVTLLVLIVIEFGKLFASNYGLNFNSEAFSGTSNPNQIIPNLLLLQSWLPNVESLSWNLPSWSISIEYYLYMIFFITLLLKENTKYTLWFLISIIMFICIFNGSEIAKEILRGTSCFFAGTLIYLLYRKLQDKITFKKSYFTIIESLILLLLTLTISSDIESKSLIVTLLFCIQILIFSFEKGFISKILKQKVFQYLGKLSYSIYMIHLIILFCVLAVLIIVQKIFKIELTLMINHARYIDFGNPIFNNIAIVFILGIIIFISGFTYKYIEQKGQKIGQKLNKKY